MFTTANAVVRAYRELLNPLGLTYTQYLVMLSLREHDSASLQAKGLLTRTRAGDDVRRLVISVTPDGLDLRERARQIPDAMLCRVGLSPEDGRTLGSLLAGMQAALAG